MQDGGIALAIGQFTLDLSILLSVGVITIYAVFVWWQTRIMRRQAIVTQEAQWIPEAFFSPENGQITFRGKRPWFPEFKAAVDGTETPWHESLFRPIEDADTIIDIEWYTEIPDEIDQFLAALPEGDHSGELHFKFESFTGEEYTIIYHVELAVSESDFDISRYSSMDRILPWDDSRRGVLGLPDLF